MEMERVRRFIADNIDQTTKNSNGQVEETLIPLPYPFTTPCVSGAFQEMYYWDTYFTQKALFLVDRDGQAENNVRNLAYMLETFQKIPNGNRTWYLHNSQPPFFGWMLADMLAYCPNRISLAEAFAWLKKEYDFWTNRRKTPNGLNAYNVDSEDRADEGTIRWYASRTGIVLKNTAENCRCIHAECESGWDFSPRFYQRCIYHNAVDLNCLLYLDERLLGQWATALGQKSEGERYCKLAEERKEKMLAYMKTDAGYFDYDYEKNTRSDVVSCAAFFPYAVGMDEDKATFLRTLSVLESEHGLVACRHLGEHTYQWGEPNGWAPLHYMAVKAADQLGLKEEAKRIAEKYLNAQTHIFQKTGRLWEKYNAATGELDVVAEYDTPELLGWSAGVYMAFLHYRESGYRQLL